MTKKEIENIIEKREIPLYIGYWTDIFIGTFLFFSFPIIGLFFSKDPFILLPLWFQFTIVFGLIFDIWIIYRIINGRKISSIESKLTKDCNSKILKNVFKNLNWKTTINKYTVTFNSNENPYLVKLIDPTIIFDDNKIYYLFWGSISNNRGRIPFSFGISTFLERKFLKVLNAEIKNQQLGA